ncbi:VWA domain-containing protein [Corynebacterium suranareeae]|uniref:VWA domain-containing protein n=1 Tax=Corynebacterium suranareeae TaxID=2506452 RepID=UPI001E325EAA|nr:VWA domain-containing protein [Corynebacterium suranareeae]
MSSAQAQTESPTTQSVSRGVPTMMVLDSSGSMVTEDAGGQSRSDAAKEAANQFIDELAGTLDLGLVTYGGNTGETPEEYEAGCQDISVVRGPTSGQPDQLKDHIDGLQPRGYTPIGDSLKAAAAELPEGESGTIVLVSDGIATCTPPPVCEVAQELADQGVDLVINTVGFNVDESARAELECIAQAGNGTYADASDADSLVAELKRAATRTAVGYESDLEQLDGNDVQTEPTQIPDDVKMFQANLPALENKDGEVTQYWSIPVADYERVQVTTSYIAPVTVGSGGDYLSVKNELQYGGDQAETCHRKIGGDSILDNVLAKPLVANVESDVIGTECDTDELTLAVTRSEPFQWNEELPVEIVVKRLTHADTSDLPLGDQVRDIPDIDVATVDSWEPLTGGSWFSNAPELTPGEGIEAEIVPGENHIYRLPMATGQQLHGYAEVVENTAPDDANVTDKLGVAVFSPTRQAAGVDLWTDVPIRENAGEYFEAPSPLTYLNMFSNDGGFGSTNNATSVFTLEGDYYLAVHYNDFSGGTTRDASDRQSAPVRYRLVADAYGDAEPGPVFDEVSAGSSESSSPSEQPNESDQAAESEDNESGFSPLIAGTIVALIVVFAAFASWMVLKGRKK